jgi:carboxyl-terminal processing protease
LHAEIQSELPEARSARGRIVEHDDTRIGLIVVPGIYLQHDGHSTSHDVRFIAGELIAQGAAVLLLDLRGNGGGVIEDAVRLAGVFAGAGPVAFEHASDGSERRLASNEAQLAWHGRVVVWVDAGTAGASELFAGAMQDRGRALVIGERTYGEGTGQTLVLLSSPLGASAGAVRVTDRVFFRLDGKALQLKGVTPDIELAPAGAPRATERDLADAIRVDDIAVPGTRELARIDRALLRRLVERPQQAAGDDAALAIASAYARATPK